MIRQQQMSVCTEKERNREIKEYVYELEEEEISHSIRRVRKVGEVEMTVN